MRSEREREADALVRLFRPSWTKGSGATGTRKHARSAFWWCDYREGGRRRRESLGTPFKADAELARAKIVERLRRKAAGLVDPHSDHAARPICEHVEAFKVTMEARGVTARHVAETLAYLRSGIEAMRAAGIGDLDLARASRWLEEARVASGLSARTVNTRAQSLRAFGRWLVETRRVAHDPFLGLRRLNVAADRRRVRRALTLAETTALLDAARRRPLAAVERRGYNLKAETRANLRALGEHRALIYAVAVGTGARRGEMSRIRWCDLDLDSEEPRLTIPAKSAKARREQSVPLSAAVLAVLKAARESRKGEAADALVCASETMPNEETFRRDLKEAGIEALADDGTVVDFHALRVTLGTRLSDAGVPLVQAQRILRHSTPVLTANIYTRPASTDLRASLDRASGLTVACHGAAESVPSGASRCPKPGAEAAEPKKGERGPRRGTPHRKAPSRDFENGGDEGARTPGLLIANPSAEVEGDTLEASRAQSLDGLSVACHSPAQEGLIDLSAALHALADAGLASDALAAAVEALLRVTRAAPHQSTPRLLGGA